MRFLPLLLLGLCFLATPAFAQRATLSLSPFTDLPESQLPSGGERRIVPQRFRALRLDLAAVEGFFQKTPLENSSPTASLPILTLPLPDGGMGRFRIVESPVMHEDLQRKYPEIRCYIGQGIDDPSATLSCDLTPWGFHAMILSDRMGTVFVDPYVHGDREYYSVYFKKDYRRTDPGTPFTCSVEEDLGAEIREGRADVPEFQGDCRLRTYRLALACTGEYANFHGGTVPLVLAAMNTSMNRVNGVFRREISATMRIVPKNDTLIFLNASTDPYANTNGSTMLNQNATVCNARIGSANFDIGHVFSTGGGGIASL
ncbi:MAG TPA: zinc-dependent metalloprotease family protein, partial [Saprospiraceae bacterium]|nr:zinc-dependent metalloprotease family protein [Saprospiraceae bacterium]